MNITKKSFRLVPLLAIVTSLLLLIPLVAMQFTHEVFWTLSDFIIAGFLLFGTGLTLILATQRTESKIHRLAIGLSLTSILFLVWTNLAMGLVGAENNDFNLFYFGMIIIGIIGAMATSFKPKGMMFVLFGMAVAQAFIAILALIMGMQNVPGSSILEILGVNGVFIVLFAASGLLFLFAHKHPLKKLA